MADSGIKVHVYGDYDDKDINKAIKDLQGLKRTADDASGGLTKMGKGLALGAAAFAGGIVASKALDFMQDAVLSASDLNEAMSKMKVIFGFRRCSVRAAASVRS